jgi:ParB family transcriptional regulator, chromosome partitioning protein
MSMELFDISIVEQIEMKMIRPSQFAVRDKFQGSHEIESLMSSIREHGLLQPILIRPILVGFEIVAGHRRFHACKSLRWRFISCKIREMSDKQAFEVMLTENIQRKSMDPVEEAEAFRKYVLDFGWGGVSELGKKIGKSEEYVSHRIQLLKLPEEVREQIVVNKLKVSQALELTGVPQSSLLEFTNKIMEKNLTIKQIREVKAAIKEESLYESGFSNSIHEFPSVVPIVKKVKLAKKTCLALRITLARLDNIIEEVEINIEPDQRKEIMDFLMNIRLRVHSMIDESIRFKNSHLKLKNGQEYRKRQ